MSDFDRWAIRYSGQVAGPGSARVLSGAGFLVGWSAWNTGATDAAVFSVYDGAADTDPVLARFSIAAGEAGVQTFPNPGIYAERGLYMVAAASTQFLIYYRLPPE